MEKKEDKPQEQEPIIKETEEEEKPADFNVFSNYMQSFSNPRSRQIFGDKQLSELMKSHKFWDTQPVLKAEQIAKLELGDKQGALQSKKKEEVRQEPYNLPKGFGWFPVDLDNEEHMNELYKLLHDHYVEDDDGYFRFDYAREFLQWALSPPGYEKDLLFCIRRVSNMEMMAFISGIFIHLKVEGKPVTATEVNFLCVHKILRRKRVAPVLIKEVTRRSNVKGVWQGFYTSGTVLPTPFAQARYYHRSLNPKKLIDINFSSLPRKQTMSMVSKIYALEEEPTIPGIRKMELKDVNQVKKLLNKYLDKFELREVYSKSEVQHFFMPRENVMNTFVVEENNKITDLISFYDLPSSILNHTKHNTLRAAYSYYVIPGKHDLKELYLNSLILAKDLGYDVFNALDILENDQVFEDLYFKPGDGFLHYYFYNWKLKNHYLVPSQIGKVLV